MASAKLLRRQAATCAELAERTHDEESRERCRWLAQTYINLAETEEQLANPINASAADTEH